MLCSELSLISPPLGSPSRGGVHTQGMVFNKARLTILTRVTEYLSFMLALYRTWYHCTVLVLCTSAPYTEPTWLQISALHCDLCSTEPQLCRWKRMWYYILEPYRSTVLRHSSATEILCFTMPASGCRTFFQIHMCTFKKSSVSKNPAKSLSFTRIPSPYLITLDI